MNKNIKVHCYKHLAGTYVEDSAYYTPGELDDNDIEVFANAGFNEVWYWYATGSWEGVGYAILRKPDSPTLYAHYMGHCSCFGPVEAADFQPGTLYDMWDSLEQLEAEATEELLNGLSPLIEMIRNESAK